MNEVYDAALITISAVGLSMVSKKILNEPLGTPESMVGTVNMDVAVRGGTLFIRYLQGKSILPVNPFKSN